MSGSVSTPVSGTPSTSAAVVGVIAAPGSVPAPEGVGVGGAGTGTGSVPVPVPVTAIMTKTETNTAARADALGRPGYRLAQAATLLAVLVVLLGAYTRLTHSGLGCPDWPGCYGLVTVPVSDAQQAHAALHFPEQPVEVAKGWSEMVHRYAAGVLAVVIGALVARLLRHGGRERGWAVLLLGLLVTQAAFGMWTVTLRLWPPVVVGHLLGGLGILALLFWLALRLGPAARYWAGPRGATGTTHATGTANAMHTTNAMDTANATDTTNATGTTRAKGPTGVYEATGVRALRRPDGLLHLRGLARLALVAVLVQAALGAWVSANYAAVACVDFPLCQGQWWPAADFVGGFQSGQSIGPNYLGGQLDAEARTAIQLTHRLGAALLSVLLMGLAWQLSRRGLWRMAALLLGLLAAQIAVGAANVWLQWPLALAVAHNAGAAALLLGMVWVNHGLATSDALPTCRAPPRRRAMSAQDPEGEVADALVYLLESWHRLGTDSKEVRPGYVARSRPGCKDSHP